MSSQIDARPDAYLHRLLIVFVAHVDIAGSPLFGTNDVNDAE
jgi:hypothetical protein